MSIKCLDGEYPFYKGDVTVATTLATIREIFEADSTIAKARAMLKLTSVQLKKLFDGEAWTHCKNLLRIGERLRLQAHDGTHAQCAQCEVIHALSGDGKRKKPAPFNTVVKIAKHADPKDQLRAAMDLYLYG